LKLSAALVLGSPGFRRIAGGALFVMAAVALGSLAWLAPR